MKTFHPLAVLLALLLIARATASAQQPTSRVSVGFGGATAPDWMDMISDVVGTVVTLGSYKTETTSAGGAIVAQYERFVNQRFALLGAAGYQRIARDVIIDGDPSGTQNSTYFHMMGGAAIHYLRGNTVGLYSNAAAGLALHDHSASITGSDTSTESEIQPAFQVTLLGLRVGRPFGAFLEVGAGYRGIVVLGLDWTF